MAKFRIRTAALQDAEAIYRVHKQSISRLCSGVYSPVQVDEWAELRTPQHYEELINDGRVLVAKGPGGVVGFAVFSTESGELEALYVHPEYVSHGIGSQLLAVVESQALNQGISAITLNATLNSAAFYERRGYSSLGPTTYRLPSGMELPCVRMRRTLA
ncbi:MAG: GNAT family N-acetyltransferase [Gemmatimonadota bacterium]|nr:MAG: GNAT family N-acetyltransferase [Gemmatimonadota bacterium]